MRVARFIQLETAVVFRGRIRRLDFGARVLLPTTGSVSRSLGLEPSDGYKIKSNLEHDFGQVLLIECNQKSTLERDFGRVLFID